MNSNDIVPCDKSKMLIVDDEPTIRKLIRLMLRLKFPDLQIDSVTNGVEAVESFQTEHQGVLVMDLHMPVMDGLKAFSKLEQQCKSNNWEMPSIIFCTGFDPSNGVKQLVENNPKHCLLLKPVDSEVLSAEVKSRCS